MKIKRTGLTVVILGLMLLTNSVYADKPSDADALTGITQGNVIWDVTIGSPSKLLFMLNVIEETYDDLERQNVAPDMVFLFHGPVLKLISTTPLDLPLDQVEAHEQAQELIQKMSKLPGVKMESCSIAARTFGVDNGTIISGIKPVGNTFVSQIGYQQKGYAMIPIN